MHSYKTGELVKEKFPWYAVSPTDSRDTGSYPISFGGGKGKSAL